MPAEIRIPTGLGMLAAFLGGIWAIGKVLRRTVARSPEECWPELIADEPDPDADLDVDEES